MNDQDFLFTCQTCSLAFSEAGVQRQHYSSDLHRYNSKRRVANLPPVSAALFEAKVVSKSQDSKPVQGEKQKCSICNKVFMSENAFADHLHSKKHKEAAARPPRARRRPEEDLTPLPPSQDDQDALNAWLNEVVKVPRLTCLFCSSSWETLEAKLKHMHTEHGFFVPDQEYLVDVEGLVARAAEEIGIFNTCLFCHASFAMSSNDEDAPDVKSIRRGLDAVRKHMNDKGHCKLPWDTEEQRLEWSDYYDYSASYEGLDDHGDDEWEDTDEMVSDGEVPARGAGPSSRPALRYGDTEYELILPSGARIGHKALRHIYRQNLVPYSVSDSRESRAARRIAGIESRKTSDSGALISLRGGEVVRAKSTGDAKEAQKATKQFLGIKAREGQRTRVAIRVGNNQKHFRDELLQ